jgi:DNA-binding SARP family transcriptional activator
VRSETVRPGASLAVQLLGRPRVVRADGEAYQFRSRKSWALLAYLLLSERPPTRAQLATLLYSEADDPLRALRWNLTEIRRCLGENVSLDGDPVVLKLGPEVVVDVDVVAHALWTDAAGLPGLGADLLEGIAIREAAAFESWLLSERRRLAAASEAILHEAALASMSRGELELARGYAVRAAAMSPLDENHQALLIRLYRLAGDDEAAEKQYAACVRLFEAELGVPPGYAVQAALRETRYVREVPADAASIAAIVEAGSAAVAAGALEAGVQSLRTAVRLADAADSTRLRIDSRLVLAEALVHSLRGLDEEGLATLFEADRIAVATSDPAAMAQARSELGYVDFLRGRYDRAELRLTEALESAQGSPSMMATATTYLGTVESDRANYGRAADLLEQGIALSRTADDPRNGAYALSMLGRLHLLRGELDAAAPLLSDAIELAERDHWLSFLPWPQAWQGEVQLARADPGSAAGTLTQAFARSCQLGDPCWEGISARGLALAAEANGQTERAFDLLADAGTRCNRLADSYAWLDIYILDAQCTLGRRHSHPDTNQWIYTMGERASRTGMRELIVRAMLHGAALGEIGESVTATILAAEIDNPQLHRLLGH